MTEETTTEREQLTKNFYRDEFACPCCGVATIDIQLVKKLQELRELFGRAITVTSGYRCTKHNQEVGGDKFSSHLDGLAADLYCRDSWKRWDLIENAMKLFQRVGVYDGWIHVDIDNTKPKKTLWVG